LLEGDYRLLYLAWLKAMTFEGLMYSEEDEDPDSLYDDRESPVPPGIKALARPAELCPGL